MSLTPTLLLILDGYGLAPAGPGNAASLARTPNIDRPVSYTHLSRTALAGLVDFSSRVAEDQRKLSLKFPLMRDVMIEASAMAAMKQSALVEAEHLEEALEARMYRANLVEELYMEEYDRELIKVRTSGSALSLIHI